jgi:non-heme chloroperoxidase
VTRALDAARFKKEWRNEGVTELLEIEGRGHSPTIDSGWREVCDRSLGVVQRFV